MDVYTNAGNGALLQLLPANARRVLDVGCGAGDNARLLVQGGRTVVGITNSPPEAPIAEQWCERVILCDVERDDLQLSAEESFDVLLFSHVLEHLIDPSAALQRLSRYLATDGIAAAAVPNMAYWRDRARMLKGDWRREDEGHFDRTHLHFWTLDTIATVFKETPFQVLQVIGADFSVPLRPLRQIAPRLAGSIDRLLGARAPRLFASQILVSAVKQQQSGLIHSH